jgi:BCD family chlorophyll transporter-like MFS transporter
MSQPLSWFGIVRLGLVQTALGAIVVIATSTINRVMVVELALPAMLPGILVALHYAVQMSRPKWGYGSDLGGRRTPWIIGGIAVLGLGGIGAATSVLVLAQSVFWGTVVGLVAFTAIGVGVGAAGTSLLALLATRVAPERRGPAATIVWVMMIMGFVITAATVGSVLDPFTPARLIAITAVVAAIALAVTIVALAGVEGRPVARAPETAAKPQMPFRAALTEVWGEPKARQFAIFVFASMLAYSAQDLILEPYAGAVFGFSPGESTKLSGVQHGGTLVGMIMVALAGIGFRGKRFGSLRAWTVGGCIASGFALLGLAFAGTVGPAWPLKTNVFLLGLSNGAFAVAAIGSMMALASEGRPEREGLRMGLWGAAQAIAFGLGGFLGTVGYDLARGLGTAVAESYMIVFFLEALVFFVSAALAARIGLDLVRERGNRLTVAGENFLAGAEGR